MADILAVDDSASIRYMIYFTLKAAGYRVTEASDGLQALALSQKQAFGLVLTDINMPVMDGLTLTRKLRQLADYRDTPILILTTEAAPDKRQQGREAGATDWLVKPFDPGQLLISVRKVLR